METAAAAAALSRRTSHPRLIRATRCELKGCGLTFNTTLLSDSQLKLAGYVELRTCVPLKDGEAKRRIWATQDVYDLLKGNTVPDFPAVEADSFVGRFCKGFIVSASRRERSKADLKWLKFVDQVWVLSFRRPSPGWRIFGRFARKNVFVAMAAYDREQLADMITYNKIAQKIPGDWENCFPGVSPFTGGSFVDYLGEMHRNDDEE